MTRKVRTHLSGDEPSNSELTPKHLSKQQFARRLYRLMISKGWTQSELGRRAGLPRDSISVYIRGKSLPTPQNLKKLAETLGVASEELLPNHVESAIEEDHPSLELRMSTNSPDKAWLRINRLVEKNTALRIINLLENDDAHDDGSGSSRDTKVQSVEN